VNVDPAGIFQAITEQGTLFWLASGCVALGITLISAAAVGQFRRLRSGRPASVQKEAGAPAARPDPAPALESNPAGEKVDSLPASVPASVDAREMLLLLRRVRSAADKMEDFRRRNSTRPAEAAESPLKVASQGVDYVFRAGIG
jgi:hypothetical protein